jgi:uncharacterized protein
MSFVPAERDISTAQGGLASDGSVLDRRFLRIVEVAAFLTIGSIAIIVYLLEGSFLVPFLVIFGFALAIVDTAFGLGYGTLATPVLLIVGFHSVAIVPSVLISQGLAACFATALHVRYRNVNLTDLKGNDMKISVAIIALGIIGVVAAVYLAISLPPDYVKVYIGALVVTVGLLMLAKPRTSFSWPKVYALSAVNGFDKAISGGGFGPLAVGGLLSLGQRIRNSVGIAVFTVTVINFAAAILYLLLAHIDSIEVYLIVALAPGAVIGALVGPGLTGRLNTKSHMSGLAGAIIAVGALALLTTFVRF